LQGQYGLLADQLVEARIVLADGTAFTVSESSHKDLLWGIRGAWHSFGVVTEFKYKIYDVMPNSTWA
jgi:FAD/FMN-containing dehydrogenase